MCILDHGKRYCAYHLSQKMMSRNSKGLLKNSPQNQMVQNLSRKSQKPVWKNILPKSQRASKSMIMSYLRMSPTLNDRWSKRRLPEKQRPKNLSSQKQQFQKRLIQHRLPYEAIWSGIAVTAETDQYYVLLIHIVLIVIIKNVVIAESKHYKRLGSGSSIETLII
jgi:hypothetical protein